LSTTQLNEKQLNYPKLNAKQLNYKQCTNCDQTQIPFKQGVCLVCGSRVTEIEFVRDPVKFAMQYGILTHAAVMQVG
jgi:uncharacterized paraquat-inducible protein A